MFIETLIEPRAAALMNISCRRIPVRMSEPPSGCELGRSQISQCKQSSNFFVWMCFIWNETHPNKTSSVASGRPKTYTLQRILDASIGIYGPGVF